MELPTPKVIGLLSPESVTARVAGVVPGARVTLYSVALHGPVAAGTPEAEEIELTLAQPPRAGDDLYAVQRLAGRASAPSPPVRVASVNAVLGAWELRPESAEVLAVHAALLRSGQVAYFSGSEHDESTRDFDHSRLWDPATGRVTTIASPPHDLFCCGHTFLADGRLLVAGGTQAYDAHPAVDDPYGHAGQHHYRGVRDALFLSPVPGADPWTTAAPMRFQRGTNRGGGRWYPTLLTLADGRVLAMSGHPEISDSRHNNTSLELFDPEAGPEGAWLDAGEKPNAPSSYPRLYLLPNGDVLCATPMSNRVERWSPIRRTWMPVAEAPGAGYGSGIEWSSALLSLRPPEYTARVLAVGKAAARILDLGPRGDGTGLAWSNTAPRTLPAAGTRHGANAVRQHATAVLLPDGSVLVVGGTVDGRDARAILHAELYDPDADQWSTLAAATVPRVYHSVALLLPDGRVWVAGSNHNGDRNRRGDRGTPRDKRELRIEIFAPPYLFAGSRPLLLAAPEQAVPGGTLTVATPDPEAIGAVTLVRSSSVTHAFNADQRHIALAFERRAGGQLAVAAPPDNRVAPPGDYLLFLVSRDGVPSVGRFLRVRKGGPDA
jgi:hypothetical protein